MKIIISCVLCCLVAFTLVGCDGIHISFDSDNKAAEGAVKQEQNVGDKSVASDNKAAQGEVKKEQNIENKSVASDDKVTQRDAKQDQNKVDKPTVNVIINEVPQTNNKPGVVIVKEPSYAPVYNGNFIFWNSGSVYLTQSQVSSLSNYQLGIARNEIFARHGFIFSTEKYRSYFNAQSWYTPITKDDTLNSIETYNVSLIKAEEDRRGVKN